MKVAIMQPYVFPYIGYFQLINAVDVFVFYDDVHFIKKGYINRNAILVNGVKHPFTIPCKSISQNKLIKDTELSFDAKAQANFLKTIEQAYKNAPYFKAVYPLLVGFITKNTAVSISEFAMESVTLVLNYLQIQTPCVVSSQCHQDSIALKKEHRLIQIAKASGATYYINPIGGLDLYCKDDFSNEGVALQFLKSKPCVYKQFGNDFVPWLSMIDVLMFNSINEVQLMLNDFELL